MYKLLLVSDQENVLNAFGEIQNWERYGFKPPHIRHDFEGAKDSLAKHHADGIALAVSPEEEQKIILYLQEYFPNVSIFQAGTTREEVLHYLNELNILLNRIHADFSNDKFLEIDMLQECRHDFFRKVMTGKIANNEDLVRNMRLLRSKMDAGRTCLLIELQQPASMNNDRLTGRWHYGNNRLELALRNSFGGDVNGIHILPTVHPDGRILVLCCPLNGYDSPEGDQMTAMMTKHIAEGVEHLEEFFGLELHMLGIQVFPSLYALCNDVKK